jgi:uncharacterized membrane protein YdbT with pleckstrin-like domain
VPFPRKLLNGNEEIVLDLHPHWWFVSGPLFFTFVAGVAAVVAWAVGINEVLLIVFIVLFLLGLVWLLSRYMKWTTTNFVVTTDRLIYRSGVVAKRGMEIPLERVNNISFSQTVFERLLRSGDLLIESAGEGGQQKFSDIRRPFEVQNEIYRQMELAVARDADRMAGRRELSVPEQLEKLDELRQRGVITNAEFEAKKAQLLDRM